MNAIRLIEPTELQDPRLRAVADRIVDSTIFAGQRALAHLAEPTTFQLPVNPASFERLFVDFIHELPDADVSAAARRVAESVRHSPLASVSRANNAVFARVDLRTAEEIELQLARLSPEYSRLSSASNVPMTTGGAALRPMSGELPGSETSSLRWRLRRLDCNEETGLTNIGSDHVYIGGVAIDAFGNSTKVPVQDLGGGWDTTDDPETWPDRTLTSFNLDYGMGWPRPCTLILAISVRSAEGLWELLDKIVAKAKDEVVRYAAAASGAVVGTYLGIVAGSLGGPLGAAAGALVGALVGYVVGYVIEKLWGWLKSLFSGTKLFKPVTLSVEVPFHGAEFDYSKNAWWKGHRGKYTATVDAVLNWGPASVPAAICQETDKLDIFRVDSQTNIQCKSWGKQTNWDWTSWSAVQNGRTTADAPINVVARKKNQLDLFVIGLDGRLWSAARKSPLSDTASQNSKPQWAGWFPILDDKFVLGTMVTGVARAENCLDVFVTGKDWKVRTAAWGPQTNYEWHGWWTVGQGIFLPGTPIATVSRSHDMIDLFAIGLDGRVWSAAWGTNTQGKWHGWFSIMDHLFLPGRTVTAISRKADQLDLFAVDGNGEVRTAAWSPGSNNAKWGGWWRVTETNGKFTPGTPIAVASRGPDQLDLFAVGLDGRVWTAAWGPQTNYEWQGWSSIGDPVFAQDSTIAAVARNPNQLDIFVNGLDGNLWSASWDGNWKWFTI